MLNETESPGACTAMGGNAANSRAAWVPAGTRAMKPAVGKITVCVSRSLRKRKRSAVMEAKSCLATGPPDVKPASRSCIGVRERC